MNYQPDSTVAKGGHHLAPTSYARPVFLCRKELPLPQEHRFFAPVDMLTYTDRRREISLFHHILKGSSGDKETCADISFGEQGCKLAVSHGATLEWRC